MGMRPRVVRKCATCGEDFLSSHGAYCSQRCRAPEKKCLYCGSEFRSYRGSYCSVSCGQKNRHEKDKVPCEWCGKPRSKQKNRRKRFCSRECAFASAAEGKRQRLERLKSEPKIPDYRKYRAKALTMVCKGCGVEFIRLKGNQVYCCLACGSIAAARHQRDLRLSEAFEARKLNPSICRNCHKPFVMGPGKGGLRLCCSEKCRKERNHRMRRAAKARSNRRRKHRLRAVSTSKAVDPKAIWKRDGRRCSLCGKGTPWSWRNKGRDRSPEIDHIVPVALGGSDDASNLQLVCRKCNGEKAATAAGQTWLCIENEVIECIA